MENLIFKHNKRPIVRIVLLLVFLLFLVGLFFIIIRPGDIWDILELVLLALIYTGVLIFITIPAGIKLTGEGLKIRWFNWLKEKNIPDTEIEKIILGRLYIHINRKDKKPMKLILEGLEKADKTRLYEFLIEYSKQKSLGLERNLNL
ncbi:MAG: hypothetical protein V1903_05465 [Bacteroidota bacterium]